MSSLVFNITSTFVLNMFTPETEFPVVQKRNKKKRKEKIQLET